MKLSAVIKTWIKRVEIIVEWSGNIFDMFLFSVLNILNLSLKI